MSDNHIIPVSNGLFDHKERIGPAIWEFLWCVDSITAEEVDDRGERWGIVLGGAPVKHERIAMDTKSSVRTVKRNMAILKDEGYITTLRAPRGEIIKVRKNKKVIEKRSAKNGTSLENEVPNMAYHNISEVPKMALHSVIQTSEVPKVAHLKDFKDLKDLKDINTAATTACEVESSILVNQDSEIPKNPFRQVCDAFYLLHSRLLSPGDYPILSKMIERGMPADFINRNMKQVYALRKKKGREIHSFSYYEKPINEAWDNELLITSVPSEVALGPSETTPAPSGTVASGQTRPLRYQSSLEKNNDFLKRAWEEAGSGQSGRTETVFDHEQRVPELRG